MKLEKFRELGLSEKSLKEIEKKGFEEPTEIQQKVIPFLLETDADLIGQAQTGTGKTAAFGLPIIEKISEHTGTVQALILTPTRELAIQVSEELNSLKGKKRLQILPVYGGQSITDQTRRLKNGVDIVVGTPGRIMDHLRRKSLILDKISFAVLDEADEMLNMGFIDDVETIFKETNPDKRTLLFSATMPDHILHIARKYMHGYKLITTKKDKLTVEQTDQIYFEVSQSDRFESLCRIIDIEEDFYGLIFCRTKVLVDELTSMFLDRGYDAEGIHGDFSQSQRERTLEKFKKKRVNILIATDVAARGIDITNLTHVINYSLPQDPESYIHRIGRTGRAGKKGVAITFISPSEYRKLLAIIKVTKTNIRKEKLPAVADIINAKTSRLISEILAVIQEGSHREYITTAKKILNDNDPLDILAALLKHSFQGEFDRSNYNEINEVSVDKKGTTRLFVSMGTKDGLSQKKLVRFIQDKSRVRDGVISDVTVKDSFSFLTAPFKEAEIIVKAFKGQMRQNRPLVHKADKGGRDKKHGRPGSSRRQKQ